MAIGTNDAVQKFGTQDSLDNTSSAVLDGAFSVAADLLSWTNDDNAKAASVVLQAPFVAAPATDGYINLFLRPLNIQSTNDSDVPTAIYSHVFVGSFPTRNSATTQYIPIDISLLNTKDSQEYELYIENQAGQTLPAGWVIYITPHTIGPHA